MLYYKNSVYTMTQITTTKSYEKHSRVVIYPVEKKCFNNITAARIIIPALTTKMVVMING